MIRPVFAPHLGMAQQSGWGSVFGGPGGGYQPQPAPPPIPRNLVPTSFSAGMAQMAGSIYNDRAGAAGNGSVAWGEPKKERKVAEPASGSTASARSVREVPDGANLYVYGIPAEWGDAELQSYFSPCGPIVAHRVVRAPDGTSKCYGFVGYAAQWMANVAISTFNGQSPVPGGRPLTVKLKDSGPGTTAPSKPESLNWVGTHRAAPDVQPGCTAYVHYLPVEWGNTDLAQHFSHCGEVVSASVLWHQDGMPKGAGLVSFTSPEAVMKAMVAMDNYAAGPKRYLSVNPKKGEESQVPMIPQVEFPPPGRVFEGPSGKWTEPGTTCFVYYVPTEWDEMDLFIRFVHMGEISYVKVNAGKGYGFVAYTNKLSAARAIKGMNGFLTGVGGSRLEVSVRKGEEDHVRPFLDMLAAIPNFVDGGRRRGGWKGSDRSLSALVPTGANLYIAGMPENWSDDDLASVFRQFGNIVSSKVARDESGKSKSYGFVGFDDPNSASIAIQSMNGMGLQGYKLTVKLKDDNKRTGPYSF